VTDIDDQDEGHRFGVVDVPTMWRLQIQQATAFAADIIENEGPPGPEPDGRELFDTASLNVAFCDRSDPPGEHWVDCAIDDPDALQWLWIEFSKLHPRFGVDTQEETFPRIGAAACPRHFGRFLWIRTGKPGWAVELVGGEVHVMVPRYPKMGVSIRKVAE